MKNNDLEQLFLRFRDDGDMRALARLFDVAAPQLLPVAVHLAARRDEADDLIQATFLTAIERAESYESDRPVLPWLLGILALHARKLRQRQGRALDLERVHQPAESQPEAIAAAAEVREAVNIACRALPETYAKIVERHLVDGLEPIELASQFGLSNGAARVRLHRGLKLLRRALPVAYSSGAYAATSTRGIGSIRAAVLQRAALLTGSPVPAAGFAPLGLLLTFLLPILAVLPAWFVFRGSESSVSADPRVEEVATSSATAEAIGAESSFVEPVLRTESEASPDPLQPRSANDAVVRGRLVLADGTPAAGASVKLDGRASNEELIREFGAPVGWQDPEVEAAAADGRFEFVFDPPRAFCFDLEVDHAAAAKASWNWFEIAPGSTVDLGDVVLEPIATLVVHIVDASSNPLSAGWSMLLESPAPSAANGRRATSLSAKPVTGSTDFVLERVPARRVTIEAQTDHGGRIEPTVVDLVANETKQIELRYTGPDLSRRIAVTISTSPFFW
ncbi:MAG TPA: RNA polymerase sigma factor, partial [Planctomycetota bacterium]|nr:RNA polymerase sigma factor [Planctomycetota bacterium]